MKLIKYISLVFGAAAVFAFAPPEAVVAGDEFQVGQLKCKTVPGTRRNYIIRSTADVDCVFEKKGGDIERYVGETGIAIGATLTFKQTEEKLFYNVAAATTDVPMGALTGKYVGGQVGAAAKKGAGGALLIGGGNNQISLSPMGTTDEGYGVSAGVGFLYIEAAK